MKYDIGSMLDGWIPQFRGYKENECHQLSPGEYCTCRNPAKVTDTAPGPGCTNEQGQAICIRRTNKKDIANFDGWNNYDDDFGFLRVYKPYNPIKSVADFYGWICCKDDDKACMDVEDWNTARDDGDLTQPCTNSTKKGCRHL